MQLLKRNVCIDKFRKNVDKTGVKGKLEDLRRKAKTRLETVRDPFAAEILNELVGILDDVSTSSGEGLGYPFDLGKLRFYERCLKAEPSYTLAKYAEILQEREVWFKKARQALRWKNGPIPLSTKVRWDDRELKAARKGIDTFLEEICLNRKEGVGLLLLLNMEIDEYVKMVYGSWDLCDGEKVCRG